MNPQTRNLVGMLLEFLTIFFLAGAFVSFFSHRYWTLCCFLLLGIICYTSLQRL